MKECLSFGRKFKPRSFMDDYCDNSISVQFAEKYSRTFSIWKSLYRLKITEIPHRNILCIMFKPFDTLNKPGKFTKRKERTFD